MFFCDNKQYLWCGGSDVGNSLINIDNNIEGHCYVIAPEISKAVSGVSNTPETALLISVAI